MERDRPDIIVFPPFAFFLAVVLTFVLRHWLPFGVLDAVPQSILLVVGLATIAVALWFNFAGIFAFRHAETNINPSKPALTIVQDGPYRFSRNPMYLGLILFVAGLGIAVATFWGPIMACLLWAILHWGVVLREEKYLRTKFGDDYSSLLNRTRRWL
ncbi:MAG: methyltransferase family protein [Boseongicola sp.]